MDAYVAAAIGFVTAAVLAMINSWLAGRASVAEGVRDQRIATYPGVWSRTGVVSRWPRTDAGRGEFLRLHEDLRRWYYGGGGLYLSTRARKRYEHLQCILDAVLSVDEAAMAGCYQPVMDAASYFRTGLTDDLETRARRGVVVALARRRDDRTAWRAAQARLRSVTALASQHADSSRPVHAVAPIDELLRLDGSSPTDQE
jgi:hypothetical protein